MTPELFIKERMYLHGVSPKTVEWYERAFLTLDKAYDSREAILERFQQTRHAVALDTGLHISELLELRWQDVDYDNQTFDVLGKGGNASRCRSPANAATCCSAGSSARNSQSGLHSLILSTRDGRPMTRDNAARDLRELAQAAGVKGKVSPHRLPPTFAQAYLRWLSHHGTPFRRANN